MFARLYFKFVPKVNTWRRFFHRGQALESILEVRMPSLSPTMSTGNIVKWHKNEGDSILPGDLLCEIQTDKTIVGFDVEQEGTLAKILKGDDSKEVAVGTLIALIADEETDWKTVEVPSQFDGAAKSSSASVVAADGAARVEAEKSRRSLPMGPAAKILLGQYGIKSSDVYSCGPRGMLLKSDVLRHIKELNLKPIELPQEPVKQAVPPKKTLVVPSAGVPSSKIETALPRHSYSKMSIPHSYSSIDVYMDSVQKLREQFKEDNLDIEYVDILVKAAAISLKSFPHMNAIWIDGGVKGLEKTNVSFLLDDFASIHQIEDASSCTVEQISRKIKEFRTKLNSAKPLNLESCNSSLLINYLGNVDITSYHGVVMPPHILCLTFVAPRYVLDENCSKRLQTTISLSVNSQVLDDVDSTSFLENIKEVLETPSLIVGLPKSQPDLEKLFAK